LNTYEKNSKRRGETMKRVKLAKVDVNEDSLREEASYPANWQEELYRTQWKVLSPYRISEGDIISNNWIDLFMNEQQGNIDFDLIRESITEEYNPFKVEYLFEKFARIDTANHDEILAFVNEYGLLGFDIEHKRIVEANISRSMQENPFSNLVVDESLQRFIEEVHAMKETLQAIKDIEEENMEGIRARRLKIWEKGNEAFRDIGIEKGAFNVQEHSVEKFLRKLDRDKAKKVELEIAKNNLSNRINGHIGYITPNLYIGQDGSYLAGYTSISLLSVMYFQVFLKLTDPKKQKIEECLQCGDLFVQRKAGVKFCPSDNDKRSTCENRWSRNKTRAREAFFTGQKKIEEISEWLNRPEEEIRSWIDNYEGKYKS
jgi:hypothetical protein